MNTLGVGVDLEALFDVEFEGPVAGNAQQVDQAWRQTKCPKCNGGGKFIGWSGRIVGPCFACDGKGIRKVNEGPRGGTTIDVAKISLAINTAFGNGIKRPKLRLDAFEFSRAPDTGKNPGAIYVKQGDQYLGKITTGQFWPVRECTEVQKGKVVEVAADPSKAATAYGHRTGQCSCCGRELTNKESIDRAIGPICAEKYGW